MSVWFCNLLLNREYSNLLTEAAFSNNSFSNKTFSSVKHSYLLAFLHYKAELLVVCLSKLYWTLFCSVLALIAQFFY